ncbi:MAG: metal ABC transporter permease [Phycisphaerales bacterium JB039]
MNTLRYLAEQPDLVLPPLVTAIALGLLGGVLSPLVALKRLAFVGQGVSHAAFGGIGLVAILGLSDSAGGSFAIVFAFCLGAAMLIGLLAGRTGTGPDTAIGIVLVGSMALGAALTHIASRNPNLPAAPSWESALFGSVIAVGWPEATVAWIVTIIVAGAVWCIRRPLTYWAFDESCARAGGVPAGVMRAMALGLLCLGVVTVMKLAGVVLATAALVLPGAAALRLTDRWLGVAIGSIALSAFGMIAGLALSFELDWPPGACLVLALVAIYAAAVGVSAVRR